MTNLVISKPVLDAKKVLIRLIMINMSKIRVVSSLNQSRLPTDAPFVTKISNQMKLGGRNI